MALKTSVLQDNLIGKKEKALAINHTLCGTSMPF